METLRVAASHSSSKGALLEYIKDISQKNEEILYEIELSSTLIDKDTVKALSGIYASLDILVTDELCCETDFHKNKAFVRKCSLLNETGLVFGFVFDAAQAQKKIPLSIKHIRSLIDFLIEQYPNHLQLEWEGLRPSAVLSTQDIKTLRAFFYATETFYTYGRAVPWFLTVVEPLRLRPSVFLGDFAEWQRCNNCGLGSSFSAENAPHTEIEKMILSFVKLKYEEKKLPYVYPAAEDMIRLHGAFSRAGAEGIESILDLSYIPDDLFSPYAQDLRLFAGEVCMESCTVKVFCGPDGPDFTYMN
ncbi:MAG: hypothetical protein K5930_03180 [Treponemataceae bacterium]|nr:hypothetical protein [Treponemataceae bacterium]